MPSSFPPRPSEPPWSIETVGGHACGVLAPAGGPAGRAVLWLHDLDAALPHGSDAILAALVSAGLPVLAPCTGRSWWLDRIIPAFDAVVTPERFVLEAVVPEFARRFGAAPPGIAVMGVGMGGQGALRLAYRHPQVFPVAAALAPAIDFHLGMREAGDREDGEHFDTLWETYGDVERARQDTAILHVHPLNWPRHQWFASSPGDFHWHDGADRLHGKLAALGIPHEAVLAGPPDEDRRAFTSRLAASAVAFAVAALERESRRIG